MKRIRTAEAYEQQAQKIYAAIGDDSLGWAVVSTRLLRRWDAVGLRGKYTSARSTRLRNRGRVLSGAGDPAHTRQAMSAVDERLVRPEDQLLLLFTPPFDKTARDPGYIKGYPPGIRENGGQYTHAAIWAVWAFAELGQGNRAHELFRLLNPISHSDTPEKAEQYRVDPYVVAADVYSVAPHVGRGGWTWYTGSASWMYRLGVENYWEFAASPIIWRSNPVFPATGRVSDQLPFWKKRCITSEWRIRMVGTCEVEQMEMDGKETIRWENPTYRMMAKSMKSW